MNQQAAPLREPRQPDTMATQKKSHRVMDKIETTRRSANKLKASQTGIAQELKRLFDDVVNEPIPPNFMELLQRLDNDDDDAEKK